MVKRNKLLFVTIFVTSLFFSFAVVWNSNIEKFQSFEDSIFFYNVSLNVTNISGNLEILFIPDQPDSIQWKNGTFTINLTNLNQIPWFSYDQQNFMLKINSTLDNHSGEFRLLFRAKDNQTPAGTNNYLYFIINATNDAPRFFSLQNSSNPYNTSANVSGSSWFGINFQGSDEESHYPLDIFNLTQGGCSKASWTNTSNCFLEKNYFRTGNTNFFINFTNITRENVGAYNLTVCIKDNINSTTNYPVYRSQNYNENKTVCQNFSLNIFYSLSINASNCSGFSLFEGQDLVCYINVTTKYSSEIFNLWGSSFLNFNNSDFFINQLVGKDWFLSLLQDASSDFSKNVLINISNLTKRNVGNWTVEIRVNSTDGNSFFQNISFFINKTTFKPKFFFNFSGYDNKTAVGSPTTFSFQLYDEDFLIPDKKFYNETINLTIRIFNQSNTSQEVFWQNFSNKVFIYQGNSPFSNQTLFFVPNSSQAGNWVINFSYTDMEKNYNYTLFNFEVLNNIPPKWNQTIFYLNCIVNSTYDDTSFCLQNVNLTDKNNGFIYAEDLENDSLNFSFVGTKPENFNLTSNGIINFRPWKKDVSVYRGNWDFNLSVSDKYFINSSLRVIINVSNVNSLPKIMNLTGPNSTDENNLTIVSFRVYDEDLLIPDGWTATREGNFTLSRTGIALSGQQNLSFSSFNDWSYKIDGNSNNFLVNFSFIPNKSHIGNHTINLTVFDRIGISSINWTTFNITVFGINNPPFFSNNINNISSAVDRQFYLKINASDIEDGSDNDGNLTFNYSLLSRNYFGRTSRLDRIFDCAGCFNSTTGVFNLTFNQSHTGFFVINISVTDKGYMNKPSATTWQIFWLFIYEKPNILFPAEDSSFNFSENSTQIFSFLANHSVGNALVYEVYLDKIKCAYQNPNSCFFDSLEKISSQIGYGNGLIQHTLSRYFGFDEETYGNLKNLTLFVYPADTSLSDREKVNSSRNFKLNISHVNSPPTFSVIDDRGGTYGEDSPIKINLSNYFFDYDNNDSFYKENLTFYIGSNSFPSFIYLHSQENYLPRISTNNIINLYSKIERTESLYIIANDSVNNSVRSNDFSVIFSPPVVQQISQSSSSGGLVVQTKFVSLSLRVPNIIRVRFNDSLEIPLSIKNSGEVKISSINLDSGFKQLSNESILINLSSNFIDSLNVGEEKNLTVSLKVNARKAGRYLAYINASSNNPKVFQEANFYVEIDVLPGVNVEEVIVFTEKLLAENPECAELRERMVEVEKLKSEGDYNRALELSNKIVESCKKTISQKRNFIIFQREVPKIVFILISSIVVILVFFIVFMIYKRVKFNKVIKEEYI